MISVDTILSDSHDLCKLEELCRLCGRYQLTNVPIFDDTHRYNYFKLINIHFKNELQISKTDILPLKLCVKCLKALMTWHEFYHDCLKVDKKYKKLIDKFSLHDPEKRNAALSNEVEVIEVSVDSDNFDFINENEGADDFDISNISIKESTPFPNTDEFIPFENVDDSNDSLADAEGKTRNKLNDHSEPASGDKSTSLPLQQKPKKKKSTVCRICGKLYTNRSTYLNHLQKAHSSHRTTKATKKSSTQQQQQEKEQQQPQKESQSSNPARRKSTACAAPTMCYKCGKIFKHPSSLRNHLKYIHAADPEAVKPLARPSKMCDLCGKLCKGNYFKAHMLKHSNPESAICKICNKVFAYSGTLRSHMKVCHNDNKPFKCTVCSTSFKRADYLRTHFRHKHRDVKMDGTYKCEHCDQMYKTQKYYLIHLKGHSDGTVTAVKPGTKKGGYRETRNTQNDTTEYWCDKCDLKFKKKNYLLLHERYVHIEKKPWSISENAEGQFKCDQCDRRFSSMTGRNYHCRHVHGKAFDMNFSVKCDHCGLKFTNRVFYAKHRAKLNGSPTCYLCFKQFSTEEELNNHIDTDHATDLPFVCDICKKRFVALKNLDHHIRVKHFNDRPFQCDLCDHKATRKDSLMIHIRGAHFGEKPYQCETCGKKFSQKNDCRKHQVKHERKESITTKTEAPKNRNNNKNQLLALGKRSTASRANDEGGSFARKRSKSDASETKTRSDGGGVDGSKHLEQSSSNVKSLTIGKPITKTTGTASVAKDSEDTESSKAPAPKSKVTESAAKPNTSPVVTLDNDDDDDDDDDLEILENKWKQEVEDDDDDDDEDATFPLECEINEDSLSLKSEVVLNKANNISKTDDVSKKDKKMVRQPKMCDVCGKIVSAKLFKEHMVMHNDPESMTCSCCGKLFSTVSTLKKHFIWTHTSLRPFMCDLCGNTFKRNDHLKLHREHFHANESTGGTAVKCGICGASVQTVVTLQSHMKRVHGENKVGSYDKDLNHKILADKSYECGICSLNFKQFSYLRIHIKFVHEKGLPWHINQGANGPYKCEPCKSTYATLQSLREHNRRRHDGAPVEKFQKECSHCGMLYKNRLHYSKHLAKISGRPTCYVCWNDFGNPEDLKLHINSEHLDELPFGCELCGVRFVYLTELRNHMYTHSKTKEFQCDQCSQSFVRKDFLKSHKRRHEGIRRHTCDECNKSFVEFCDLRKHMLIHLKNKSFAAAQVKEEN